MLHALSATQEISFKRIPWDWERAFWNLFFLQPFVIKMYCDLAIVKSKYVFNGHFALYLQTDHSFHVSSRDIWKRRVTIIFIAFLDISYDCINTLQLHRPFSHTYELCLVVHWPVCHRPWLSLRIISAQTSGSGEGSPADQKVKLPSGDPSAQVNFPEGPCARKPIQIWKGWWTPRLKTKSCSFLLVIFARCAPSFWQRSSASVHLLWRFEYL